MLYRLLYIYIQNFKENLYIYNNNNNNIFYRKHRSGEDLTKSLTDILSKFKFWVTDGGKF